MIPVQVVGLGMSLKDLSPRVLKIIREAEVLVGGRRLLDYFPDHSGVKIPLGKDLENTLRQIPPLTKNKRVVVLASGDPNFYGVGPLVVKLLGADMVTIHPNITAVQAVCGRLKISWQDARVISLHGRSWEVLAGTLKLADKLIIYTDPEHTPGDLARFLRERGQSGARLCVLEDLGQETERLTWLSPEEAQARNFSPLNMVVVLPEGSEAMDQPRAAAGKRPHPPYPGSAPLHLGLPEAAWSHQAGLITKVEVRAVVLAKLELHPNQVLWDVGAGCGSVGLEASLLIPGGKIFAVEQDAERAAQISANRDNFGVQNLEVVCGHAPECLAALPSPQRAFIGGGGQDLRAILREVLKRLGEGGRIVVTATLMETLETARTVLAQGGWEAEVTQIQVSRSHPLGTGNYLQALNPVWIIAASPGEPNHG